MTANSTKTVRKPVHYNIRRIYMPVVLSVLYVDAASAHDITNINLTNRSANCAEYADTYTATATDIQNAATFEASISIASDGNECLISSNEVPTHDFNGTGRFANVFKEQSLNYKVTANPSAAAQPKPFSLQYDDAVFLDGVKLDLLAAGCYGVG